MSQLLQATKITRNGRISLGQETMDVLRAQIGDHVKIFEQDGYLWLVRDEAPSVPKQIREVAVHA